MKIKYRPEIDGLRAIAVFSVIFYHANVNFFGYHLFQGGFIGVDIFFVISGYLITSIILKELLTTGSFSFKYFYERRIRRILPVLLFVMLVSIIFAWIYMLPSSLLDFVESILYSLSFISNYYFYFSGQEYGAESSLLKPFLHTWSLSVEEQYYIFFPFVIIIVFKYFNKYLIHTLFLFFFISLIVSDWTSRNNLSISFYFFHTRIWELLTGSLLAYFEIKHSNRNKYPKLNLILPTVGLLLIGHSIIFFNDTMLHPSYYTLLPIIGVSLVIWFSNKAELMTKILSNKLIVWFGLISYSLYLWHYPVFAFARITYFFQDNILLELSSGILILILSIFSYYFIEKPLRNKNFRFNKLVIIILSSLLLIILFSFFAFKENGFKTKLPKIFQEKLWEENISLHQTKNSQKVFLIGDSHADALTYNLNAKIKNNDLSLFKVNIEMYLKDIQIKNLANHDDFIKRYNQIDNFLYNNSNLIVIFHQRWSHQLDRIYLDNEYEDKNLLENQIKLRLSKQIKSIIDMGHQLILVYPVVELNFIPNRLLYRKYLFDNNFNINSIPILSVSYDLYKKRHRLIYEILDNIQSPNIHRVYPHKLFCNKRLDDKCVANDENNIFYYDDNHLSIRGSEFVVDEIMNKIKEIKLNIN